MDRELRETVKGILNALWDSCDELDAAGFGMEKISCGKLTTRRLLTHDILRFAMYLSASDGTVTWEEATLLSDILGERLTSNAIVDYINEEGIYSVDFESTPPAILKMFVELGHSVNMEETAIETTIELFEFIGKAIVECDDNISAQEREDLNIYLNMMRNYAIRETAMHERNNGNSGTAFIGGKR